MILSNYLQMQRFKEKIGRLVSNRILLLSIVVVFSIVASIQSLSGSKPCGEDGRLYSNYNNYQIFERSFHHLKAGQDLYILYPDEHWDLYKYTPTFSVFFGFFSLFPDWLGLNLWNLLNALVFFVSVYYLPRLNQYQKGLVILIVLIELLTSLQNEQSNALIAGLTLLSFALLERNKPFLAAFCITFSVFIKLFGILGFALFIFYPNKLRSIAYAAFWTLFLLLPPLLFVDPGQYVNLLSSYVDLLIDDHHISYGFSVMGLLNSWFSADVSKKAIVMLGAVVFLLPLVRIKMYKEVMFRYLFLCSALIWVIIFNHKSESPTFIIAMTGVALWFVLSKKSILNTALFISAIILTTLSPTDLFPAYLRNEFVKPYVLKALPVILIWLKIIYDMMKLKEDDRKHAFIRDKSQEK